jgi:hypothetical protein
MKKLLTLVAAAGCMAVQTYGQGTVTFVAANITNSVTGALAVSGTSFKVALYWLPDGAQPPTSAFDAPSTLAWTTNLTLAGGANAGIVRIEGITPSGAPAWFQVRAWENIGGNTATWQDVLVATGPGRGPLAGTSNVGRIDTGDPTTVPPGTAPNTALTLKGFTLVPIPEPSVIGLGVLGLASLFLLRRRS